MLPREIRDRITQEGRAQADQRHRAEIAREREVHERVNQAKAEERARADAAANAENVWAWVASPEGDELRASMREHRLERLRLGVWGLARGERRAGVAFGSVTVDLLADAVALHIAVHRGYVGGSSRRVCSTAALTENVPSLALAALASDVRAGCQRVFRAQRERTRLDRDGRAR
jgi:hypothetical protein